MWDECNCVVVWAFFGIAFLWDWNEKCLGKFDRAMQNEAGQKLIEFCQENALGIENTLFQQHKKRLYHGHHEMVNNGIRLIIVFTAKDGEVLYS